MNKHVHIIAFNIPSPPNYGGVIDVFYKITALHKIGVRIILHCFEYNRPSDPILEQYCEKVFYYKRDTSVLRQLHIRPYIVNSRNHPQLLQNLLLDNYPILFEGLHTCYFINHPKLNKRHKVVRMHNIEWQYYQHLVKLEKNAIHRTFFQIEAWRLKRYETILKYADTIVAISPLDENYLKQRYSNVHYIPAFHPNETIQIKEGRGTYALFHGDLSVKDNEESAFFLIQSVFKNLEIPLVIAGLNPSNKLSQLIEQQSNVTLKPNLPFETLQQLIQEAHINILISFHSAGMKLKLLNALYNGRFCIVNTPMVKETGLANLCLEANNPKDLEILVKEVFLKTFREQDIDHRKQQLEHNFSNIQQALSLSKLF